MRRLASLALLALLALAPLAAQASEAQPERYRFNVQKLPPRVVTLLKQRDAWRPGCPVPLSGLRLVTVGHWDWNGNDRLGQLVVHRDAAVPMTRVFRRLYELKFPIRHMQLTDIYGTKSQRPENDVTGAFFCRQSVPSPCTGGTRSGRWSNHAYGLAIDVNPFENPYVGCGMTRDPRALRYVDRTPLRKGMVTPAVVSAFRSIGWGWGGSWTGQTKDYMHFSHNGR